MLDDVISMLQREIKIRNTVMHLKLKIFSGYMKYGGDPQKKKFETLAAFGGFILICAIITSILWVLWVVFDIMSGIIKNLAMPICKMVQC